MNADGSGQARLTNNAANDLDPSWSPDGTKIAFTSNRNGNAEVYVMNADGSDQVNRSHNLGNVDQWPAWSPDGSHIAVASDGPVMFDIYVINADGSSAFGGHRLTTDTDFNDTRPAWSPDGAKIAFTSDRDDDDEVYVMNSDGSDQVDRTSNAATDAEPDWQPEPSPKAGLAPSSMTFGDVRIGDASAVQQLTISNTAIGAPALVIGQLATQGTNAGDFALGQDLCSGTSVAAGSSCTVDVRFAPTAVGARTASVTVPSNAKSSPGVVALSGNGIPPSADVRLVMTGPASAPRGAQVNFLITVTNIGPSTAHNVVLSNPVPTGATYLGVTTSQGKCAKPAKGTINCSLGDLTKDGNAGSVVSVKLTAQVGSTVTDLATAYSTANAAGPATADPDTTNNWTRFTTTVTK